MREGEEYDTSASHECLSMGCHRQRRLLEMLAVMRDVSIKGR